MKRAQAHSAIDEAFADTLGGAFRNLLNGFFSDKPSGKTLEQDFREALARNVAAHRMACRAIADTPDLED